MFDTIMALLCLHNSLADNTPNLVTDETILPAPSWPLQHQSTAIVHLTSLDPLSRHQLIKP